MREDYIKALKLEPGKKPEIVTLENKLSALQDAVHDKERQGGRALIEVVQIDEHALILCNEEAKLYGLTPNRIIGGCLFCGTIYIIGINDEYCEEFSSLPKELIDKYIKKLRH